MSAYSVEIRQVAEKVYGCNCDSCCALASPPVSAPEASITDQLADLANWILEAYAYGESEWFFENLHKRIEILRLQARTAHDQAGKDKAGEK